MSEPATVLGIMSVPRYGSCASLGVIHRAFNAHGIPLRVTQGVFWGQLMAMSFQDAIDVNADFAVTVDYDSLITPEHLAGLLLRICKRDDIDCLAALEPRRNKDGALMVFNSGVEPGKITSEPIQVRTAHFGLTAFRVESMQKVAKPWFQDIPDPDGSWGPKHLDADIQYWHEWGNAGNTVFVDPMVRIGHLEETASYFDDNFQLVRSPVPEWRRIHVEKQSA